MITQNTFEPPRTSRELTARYQRACALCSQRDPDLLGARRLLLACALADPANLLFIETLLQVLRRLGPAGRSWRRLWYRIRLRIAETRRNWQQFVHVGLQLVVLCPTDPGVLCGLGEAYLQLGHSDVALRFWITASMAHQDSTSVQRRCADALGRLGLFEQARCCWERVLELSPDDNGAREAVEAYSAVSQTSTPADSAPLPSQDCDPSDAGAALALAQTLSQQGQVRAAAKLLEQAVQACPGELRLIENLEDLHLELARQHLELGRRRREQAPGPATQQLADDLHADLLRREIEVYGARCQRYPTEPAWKLKLAHSLKQVGNYEEACRTLEPLLGDGSSKCEAAVELGECRQHQRHFDAALDSYELAAKAVPSSPPFSPIQKLALYRAGVLALHMNDLAKASRYLQRLALGDPQYKDVARHLDKIDSIRDKDGFSSNPLPP